MSDQVEAVEIIIERRVPRLALVRDDAGSLVGIIMLERSNPDYGGKPIYEVAGLHEGVWMSTTADSFGNAVQWARKHAGCGAPTEMTKHWFRSMQRLTDDEMIQFQIKLPPRHSSLIENDHRHSLDEAMNLLEEKPVDLVLSESDEQFHRERLIRDADHLIDCAVGANANLGRSIVEHTIRMERMRVAQ